MSSKAQGKQKQPSGYCYFPLRDSEQNKSALPVVGRAPFLGRRFLLLGVPRLKAVSDGEVPLDQGADLLDHQVGVLRECAQYILESLKSGQRVQKVFHKLLLLLAWDAYV